MVSMETLVLHQGFHGKHYSTLGCYFKADQINSAHGLVVGFMKILCALYALMALVLFIKPLWTHLHPVILCSETFVIQ